MKLLHDGPVFELYRVGVKMSDGEVVARDFLHYGGAAVVLPVLSDGRMVLIRNRRFAVGEYLWEFPAGMIDPGEEPEVCASRELIEETGYKAGRVETLGSFYLAPGTADEVMHCFLASDLEEGPQQLEKHEEITVDPRTPAEVRRMVLSGEIRDGKTLALLALYWLREGELPEA